MKIGFRAKQRGTQGFPSLNYWNYEAVLNSAPAILLYLEQNTAHPRVPPVVLQPASLFSISFRLVTGPVGHQSCQGTQIIAIMARNRSHTPVPRAILSLTRPHARDRGDEHTQTKPHCTPDSSSMKIRFPCITVTRHF